MNTRLTGGLAAIAAAALVAACGAQSTQDLLASARASLAAKDDRTALIQVKNVLQSHPDSGEARFLLGAVLLDQGDFASAELELRKAQAVKYAPEQVAPKLAHVLLAAGQYKKLTDEFGATTLATPAATADLQTSLAYARAMQGDHDGAETALKAALAADPAFAPALVAQARFVAGTGDTDGALARVDAVLKRDPHSADAWRLRGDILVYAKSRVDEALADYRKAVEADPESTAAHVAILSILLQQRKPDDAEKQLAQLRKVTGRTPQTVYIEAMIAYMRQDMGKTRQLAQLLLKVAPDSLSALLLASAVEVQGNGSMVQAQAWLEHAVQIAPDAQVARRMLVTTYLRTNQPDRALTTLMAGKSKDAIPPRLYAVAGETYAQNGDLKTAADFFAKAAKLDPQDTRTRTSLALTHLVDGDAGEAFGELQTISAGDKGTVADLALINARMRRGELDPALAAVDVLARKQPGQPLPAELRGQILLQKKDVAGARKSFEQAVAVAPSYFPAVSALVQLDLADQRVDDARKRLQDFSTRFPTNTSALIAQAVLPGTSTDAAAASLSKAVIADPLQSRARVLLIDVYLMDKDMRRASAAAQDAVAALPDRPELVEAQARVQQAAGETNQAIASYIKLTKLQPDVPEPWVQLADIQAQAKDPDAARTSLRKALDLQPDLFDAQRRLAAQDLAAGDADAALAIARTAQQQHPDRPDGYALQGDLQAVNKDWPAAAASYRQALKAAPLPALAVKLHDLLLAGGTPEAGRFEASWRQAHPDDAVFLSHLGDVAMARKDYTGAESRYLAVVKLQPGNASAYNNLAWVANQQNKDSAIDYAEKANQLAPNQPPILDTLAGVLAARNQVDRAIELQRKAVDLVPGNADLKLNLAKLYLKRGQKTDARTQLDQLAALGSGYSGQAEVANLLKQL